jgi:hypothetical protein
MILDALRSRLSRRSLLVATVAGLLVVVASYSFLFRSPRSVQAFINTDIVTSRAPRAGRVSLSPDVRVGRAVRGDEDLGRLSSQVESLRASDLQIQRQELLGRVAVVEEQLRGIDHRLDDRGQLVGQFHRENHQQKSLEVGFQEAQLRSARETLLRVTARAEVASASAKRTEQMFATGGLPQQRLDEDLAASREASAEQSAAQARVAQLELEVQASRVGLQLAGPRTLSQTEARSRELRSELVDIEQERGALQRALEGIRASLARVEVELHEQTEIALRAPRDGVVWSVDAQSGESVAAGASIVQVADCQSPWVEAFFDESDAPKLVVGGRAKIRLLHEARYWSGTVETVRAGTGRVSVGQYVVEPPPEIARRQLPVRVVTARVRVEWKPDDIQPAQFCLAGRSVEVALGG